LAHRQTDIQVALSARKWPYKGFKVKASEEGDPIKRVKAREKPMPKGFKALTSYGVGKANDGSEDFRLKEVETASQPLDDGMEDAHAPWQTDPWSPPPVAPDERIPMNEFRNVELELLNPGLVHIDEPRAALVAKQLGMHVPPLSPHPVLSFGLESNSNPSCLLCNTVHVHLACLVLKAMVGIVHQRFVGSLCMSMMKRSCEKPMWRWQVNS
jgi:hypothetical protein